MKKFDRKIMLITGIVILLPVIAGILLWDKLPETMATHFGIDNEANGYNSKLFTVAGIPCILFAVQWLLAIITYHDPKQEHIHPKIMNLVLWIIPIVSVITSMTTYLFNMGIKVDITMFSELMIGLMFIIIGNFLPKCRQNYTVGIKLPWTLANEENWNRTHRLGGYFWVIGGILIVLMTLTHMFGTAWRLAIFIVIIAIPSIYSYWLHVYKSL